MSSQKKYIAKVGHTDRLSPHIHTLARQRSTKIQFCEIEEKKKKRKRKKEAAELYAVIAMVCAVLCHRWIFCSYTTRPVTSMIIRYFNILTDFIDTILIFSI